MNPKTSALILGDLQNDFLHPDGAYGRAKQSHPSIAALPERLGPLVRAARARSVLIVATLFTLVPGRSGAPIISPHLKTLRPFLTKGDFESGSWGQQLVDALAPADVSVEKIAYSAFYMSRLEWVLRKCGVEHRLLYGDRDERRRRVHATRCPRPRIRMHLDGRWLRGVFGRRSPRRRRRIEACCKDHDSRKGDRVA